MKRDSRDRRLYGRTVWLGEDLKSRYFRSGLRFGDFLVRNSIKIVIAHKIFQDLNIETLLMSLRFPSLQPQHVFCERLMPLLEIYHCSAIKSIKQRIVEDKRLKSLEKRSQMCENNLQ